MDCVICLSTGRVLSQLQTQGCIPDSLPSSCLFPSVHHAVQRYLNTMPRPLEVSVCSHYLFTGLHAFADHLVERLSRFNCKIYNVYINCHYPISGIQLGSEWLLKLQCDLNVKYSTAKSTREEKQTPEVIVPPFVWRTEKSLLRFVLKGSPCTCHSFPDNNSWPSWVTGHVLGWLFGGMWYSKWGMGRYKCLSRNKREEKRSKVQCWDLVCGNNHYV